MTRDQIIARFPNASEAFIQQNANDDYLIVQALSKSVWTGAGECTRVGPPDQHSGGDLRTGTEQTSETVGSLFGSKTERRWFEELLRQGFERSEILIQSIKFRIADKCWFCPDLIVRPPGKLMDRGFRIYDVKGAHIWEDSTIKIKACARLYPEHIWIVAQWKKGSWIEKRIQP